MTYNVFGGTLNPYSTTSTLSGNCWLRIVKCIVGRQVRATLTDVCTVALQL